MLNIKKWLQNIFEESIEKTVQKLNTENQKSIEVLEQQNKARIKAILEEKNNRNIEQLIQDFKREVNCGLQQLATVKARLIRVEKKLKDATRANQTNQSGEINKLMQQKNVYVSFYEENEKLMKEMKEKCKVYEDEYTLLASKITFSKVKLKTNTITNNIDEKLNSND